MELLLYTVAGQHEDWRMTFGYLDHRKTFIIWPGMIGHFTSVHVLKLTYSHLFWLLQQPLQTQTPLAKIDSNKKTARGKQHETTVTKYATKSEKQKCNYVVVCERMVYELLELRGPAPLLKLC